MATVFLPTEHPFITENRGDNSAFILPEVGIAQGAKLRYDGNTNNATGTGGYNANQAQCGVQVPAGTASGTTITISNTKITAQSFVLLQPVAGCANLRLVIPRVPTTNSVVVEVYTTDGAVTASNFDVWYWVFN